MVNNTVQKGQKLWGGCEIYFSSLPLGARKCKCCGPRTKEVNEDVPGSALFLAGAAEQTKEPDAGTQEQGPQLRITVASEGAQHPLHSHTSFGGQVLALNFGWWKLQLDLVETRKEQ